MRVFQLALNRQAAVDELAGAKAFIGDAAERQKSVQSQLTALQRQIADFKAEVTAIREPVREQLLAKRKKDGQPAVGGPEPIAAWDFGKGTEDQLGQLNRSSMAPCCWTERGRSPEARHWPNRSAQRHSRPGCS